MAFGGEGPTAVIAMWVLTAVTFVFVALRTYTRIYVVQSSGIDDHVYNLAFLFLLCYVIFITVAASFGFGRSTADITDPDDAVNAVLFEAIGQTFAVIGMAVAKSSLGLFLLRLVHELWHKIVIWVAMFALMGASISTCFVFWLQCTPPAYLWDRRIPDGYCHINSTPVSMLLCILCVLVDFLFALFPWLFIWSLKMNKREKIVILISMSLGVIAGACGIKRTIEVPMLSSSDYLKDTVGLIVWSAAEIAVTMICIGIPVCRPLYKTFLGKFTSQGSSYHKSGGNKSGTPIALRTFGGSARPNLQPPTDHSSKGSKNDPESLSIENGVVSDRKSPSTFYVYAGRTNNEEHSDEEVLVNEYHHGMRNSQAHAPRNGIKVTDEFYITSRSKDGRS